MKNEYYLENQICILDTKPCRELMTEVCNQYTKPSGGLWTSTLIEDDEALSGWHEYLLVEEDFFKSKYKSPKFYKIKLKKNAKIFYVNKQDYYSGKYDKYISEEGIQLNTFLLDYAKIAKEYDVIRFQYIGWFALDDPYINSEIYKMDYRSFVLCLDCESSVITNFDIIESIEEIK